MPTIRAALFLVVAMIVVTSASAQVHVATPLDVLLARYGATHQHHGHSAMEAHSHDMTAMTWDASAVTSDAMPAASAAPATMRPATEASAKTFTIIARQFEYEISPAPFVVNAGDDVTLNISVPSDDGSPVGHGFFLESYMTQQLSVGRGRSTTVHFVANTPGTFTYFCTVTCGEGHPGMNGIFTVSGTVQNPAPSISAINPNTGPASGGTVVTIAGSNFVSGARVTIGGIEATGVNVVNASTITATTPAFAPNEQLAIPKDVVVTNPDGQAATLAGAFTYSLPPLTVSLIDPSSGSTSGGMTVTLTGTGFSSAIAMTVTFGGIAATNVTVVDTTTLRVTAPAHAAGRVDVKVTAGTSVTVANGFSYLNAAARRRAAAH